jgi:lysophospholipase L1-like esterase
MMRRIATSVLTALLAAGIPAAAQERALLGNPQAFELYTRVVNLMESTTAAVPGLARAGAPVIENVRQSLASLRTAASPQDGALHYAFLTNVRAYLALADAVPKPFPFPEEGRRQFAELRDTAGRVESHFRALLELKETQLRSPDRDNLGRYQEANTRTPAPQSGKMRVVFLGDSITDGWRLNEYFPDRDFINRGISGQITGQMLARMKADVIALQPAAVIVLAGTNDIARGTPLPAIQGNLEMIADLADGHKIKPIFCSVLPVSDYHKDKNPAWEMTKRRPPDTIRALNTWLVDLCRRRNYLYVDYFTATVDPAGFLKAEFADDGLHPNAAGYRVMAPLALASIDKLAPAPVQEKKRKKFPF